MPVVDTLRDNWMLVPQLIRAKVFNLQTIRRAFGNGQHHYDIGNDLYEAMLDPRMLYTCAFWNPADTLAVGRDRGPDVRHTTPRRHESCTTEWSEDSTGKTTMRLAQFISANAKRIISEWEEFARLHLDAAHDMDLKQRRDHVEGMLDTIAADLATPQTKREQASKATGKEDASVVSDTAANAHGTDRAATGFSPIDVVSEFRALRASVVRMWSETESPFNREDLEELTRFNEAIDQQLVESMSRYIHDVDRSKDLFLGVLGHDLRNPLGAIMMSATVMMTTEGPDWAHQKTAARILNAGTRMDGLIRDLVDVTRYRLGTGIPIVRVEMNLETICRQTVDEISAFHPSRVVNFSASGDLHGRWDGGRIAQALSNLCGNAFQHGSENAPIDVAVRGEADHVTVAVHNEGHEIPRSRLRDIFDPFRQLDPGHAKLKDSRSVGLGLYIVQAIANAHEGTIDVESDEQGTTFTLRLPRAPNETKSTAATTQQVH